MCSLKKAASSDARRVRDLVGFRLGAFDFLHLLGRGSLPFFGGSLAGLRSNGMISATSKPAACTTSFKWPRRASSWLTQTAEGSGRDVRAARQPVAENDIVASSGTDAVGRQQAGDLLDVQGILQRRFCIDVARCLQRQGEGKRLGLVVGRFASLTGAASGSGCRRSTEAGGRRTGRR